MTCGDKHGKWTHFVGNRCRFNLSDLAADHAADFQLGPSVCSDLDAYPSQNGKNQDGSGLRLGLSGFGNRDGDRRSHS